MNTSPSIGYRLGKSTVAEPLINNWAVWSDLIAPAPYSLHMVNYQLKTLSSYLAGPELHVKACRNPKLMGGPFVDIPAERADAVKELIDRTEREQAANIRLAQALTDLQDMLNREARGQSLEPYYEKVPEVLRGYVELVYDYYSHPLVRVIESLLYSSPYYRRELQSVRLLRQARDDSRPFFVSTPRLHQKDQIDLRAPFDAAKIDDLFRLEHVARPFGEICETLEIDPGQQEALMPLLDEAPAEPYQRWLADGVRLRYFGHACVLIEWNGVSVLTDPFIAIMPDEGGLDRFTYMDLPEKIDLVLITHTHHDHFVPETLLRIRHRVDTIVVPKTTGLFYADTSLKLMAQRLGFKSVIELDSLESVALPGGEIIAIPFLGEHADLPHGKSGYIVRAGREQILFAADSNCLEKKMYEHICNLLGPVETVFLGMECVGAPLSWLYGSLLQQKLQHSHDQSRRTKGSNSTAALNLLEALKSKRVYIYAMGSEPWLQFSMGLGLSADSPQIKESNIVIQAAREKGFTEALRPFGKHEIHLTR